VTKATVNIINYQGQKVYEATITSGNNKINTALASGIYLLQIKSDTKTYSQKIVIK
jgi:hypothetical protein